VIFVVKTKNSLKILNEACFVDFKLCTWQEGEISEDISDNFHVVEIYTSGNNDMKELTKLYN